MIETNGERPAAAPERVEAAEITYVLNPSLSILRSTDNEIIARFGSRATASHRITDTENRGRLADFAEAFATPSTPSAVAADIELATETAAEFTDYLTAGGVLIDHRTADYSYLVTGLRLDSERRDVRVGVVGTGRLAAAVQRQLTDLVGDNAVAADLGAAFEESDLVVVCSDTLTPGLFYDADEAARASDVPWHLSYVDGAELLVGPTFIPGVTANYYDRDTLDEAARVMRFDYQYLKSSPETVEASSPLPQFVAELAAAYTCIAIAQHLWGRGSFTEDHVLRVDLERMHIIRDRVLRLPRNPVSVASRADLRHPFI